MKRIPLDVADGSDRRAVGLPPYWHARLLFVEPVKHDATPQCEAPQRSRPDRAIPTLGFNGAPALTSGLQRRRRPSPVVRRCDSGRPSEKILPRTDYLDANRAKCESGHMIKLAKKLLDEFDTLPDLDRSELLAELARRVALAPHDLPQNDDFVAAADRLFVELDRREPSE